MNKTLNEILASDVYDELFMTSFYAILTKFVNEYGDMSQMTAIKQAQKLLKTFND